MADLYFALWGLLGAITYAGPRTLICHRECVQPGTLPLCYAELVVALFVGAASAAAYTEWVGHYFARAVFFDPRAFAYTIGLVANPIAPLVVKMVSKRMAKASGADK